MSTKTTTSSIGNMSTSTTTSSSCHTILIGDCTVCKHYNNIVCTKYELGAVMNGSGKCPYFIEDVGKVIERKPW